MSAENKPQNSHPDEDHTGIGRALASRGHALSESAKDHPRIYGSLGVAAATIAAIGVAEFVRRMRKRRQGEADPEADALLEEIKRASDDHAGLSKVTRKIARQRTVRDEPPDIREETRDLSLLTRLSDDVSAHKEDLRTELEIEGLDARAAVRFLREIESMGGFLKEEDRKLRRTMLSEAGYRAVAPDSRQWQKVSEIVALRHPFPELRAAIHGMRDPYKAVTPENVIAPDCWLALRHGDTDVFGYASFVAVEHIDQNTFDFSSLSMHGPDGILGRRIPLSDVRGNTIILTNVLQRPGLARADTTEALFYAVEDLAVAQGAANVLAASKSPYIALRQEREARAGKRVRSYMEHWDDENPDGRPKDWWKRIVQSFSQREVGRSERFIQISLGQSEIFNLMSIQTRRKRRYTEEQLQQIWTARMLFFKNVPAPVVRSESDPQVWTCAVPAAWQLLYNRDEAVSDKDRTPIFTHANYP